jgi:hypothetical protein
MPTFEIPTGPSISERGTTYLVSDTKLHCGKCTTTDAPYGSITYNWEKGRMPLEWENEDKFLVWLAAEEHVQMIKLIVSVTEESDSPNWRARHMYRCLQEFSGGKQDRETVHEWDQKIPSMKTGCQCRLIIKKYLQTETILGKYDSRHNHPLGDENLRYLRLSHKIRSLVMDMIREGTDPEAIMSHSLNTSFPSQRPLQLKHIHESCKRMECNYHITTCDISCLRRIVENDKIRLDPNDAISVRLWVTKLQQCGAKAVLKDKLDPPPEGSGLLSDTFVLCIQTEFQRDRFRALCSDFLSIDATHNTTQYAGVQLFTLIVRDAWGHSVLCGAILFTDTYSPQVCLLRGCCHQTAQKQQYSFFLIS